MFAVIMAGGSGTRFWPISRSDKPKQFLNITGKDSMIVETCNRLSPIMHDDEMIIVLGKEHMNEAEKLLKDRDIHILAEPVGRNTAPCIGLGAIYAQHLGYEGPIAFLPADHFIGNPASFLKALENAGKVSESGGIVTLGIVPTRPETGYGYIKKADPHTEFPALSVYRVDAFVEKPEIEKARQYLTTGDYLWNAGIFIATPKTILKEMETHLPETSIGLEGLRGTFQGSDFEEKLRLVYDELESVSFDYGIMEKTQDPVYVLPCECGWSDVGSWASLYKLKKESYDSVNNYTEGNPILVDCKDNYISCNSERTVACLGIDDCIVVETNDAILIADMSKSQEIRKIVELLTSKGKRELL